MHGYIIGAGAQGRIIAEVWRAVEPTVTLSFLDDTAALVGTSVLGIAVDGPVATLRSLDLREVRVIVGIGNNMQRLQLAETWDARGVNWARVMHPSAVVFPSAEVDVGTVVFAQAVVNSGAQVGRHVIINSSAIVEHDAVIEAGASLGPGVSMGGRVHIERGAFVSTGVSIAPRVRIGAQTVVGAGACVVEDLPPRVLAYGVPARVVRALGDDFDYQRLL